MRKYLKRALYTLASLALVVGILAFTLLSCAKVQLTANGAPSRLRIPLLVADLASPITVAAGDGVTLPGFLDGPIVRRQDNASWDATWFCEDQVKHMQGNGDTLRVACAGDEFEFSLQKPAVPSAVGPMPDKVAVLSDIEGNPTFLNRALQKLGVVDANARWSYATGHLVIVGDSVDRGRGVFATLWRLHELSLQAQAAGGAVHVLLGNHEQKMLRTNPDDANPEHLYALNRMGGYPQAFAADTLIGNWLRQQPVMLKLGQTLFVHGGVSPDVAASGLSVAEINAALHDYWRRQPGKVAHSAALDAALGAEGVTWYRGYFRAMEGRYPKASEAEVEQIRNRFGVERIVVGHTRVKHVKPMYDGKVYAVNVNHNEAAPEVLVFESGVPRIVDIGIGRGLPEDAPRKFRGFSLWSADDRALLAAMFHDQRRLTSLPYPY